MLMLVFFRILHLRIGKWFTHHQKYRDSCLLSLQHDLPAWVPLMSLIGLAAAIHLAVHGTPIHH